MDLGTAIKRAIMFINEYSTDGNLNPTGDNLDYTLRMKDLADDAQNQIADKVPIESIYTIDSTVEPTSTTDSLKKYTMPTTFKKIRSVWLNDEPFNDYRLQNRQFIVPNNYTGTFEIQHYKHPAKIDGTTDDAYEFEVDAETHHLIPYFIGGMVITDENAILSDKLLNMFFSRLGTTNKQQNDMPKRVREVIRW